MKLPQTRDARSGDLRLAYQVVGQGPINLVFVPGFLSNLDVHWEDPGYAHLLRRLSGFTRLIQFEKRGTGLSDRVDPAHLPDLETRMDDVRAVMDAAGSGRAALLGASEGAPMSLLFAATHPERVRALVLYGGYACFHRWVQDAEAVEQFVAQADTSWGQGRTLRAFAPGRAGDPEFRGWWARFERLSCSPNAGIALARMNSAIDLRAILPGIRVPTLILHRRHDARASPEAASYLARHIPGAELRWLEGRDHPIWTGDTDAAVDAIEEFLTRATPSTQPERSLAALLALRITGASRRALLDGELAERAGTFDARLSDEARCFGGSVVASGPEGRLLRLDGPSRALGCARNLSALARSLGIGLGQGVHVGEVLPGEGAASGVTARIALALAGEATPGVVLVSMVAAEVAFGTGQHFVSWGEIRIDGACLSVERLVPEQHLEPARGIRGHNPDLTHLTLREREVLGLVAEGLSNHEIAERLELSAHTVKRHVTNILLKLDLPSRAAAAALLARSEAS
ncbi:alpha/beta fold hydrolase [Paracoccus sp. MC1862]|uniref:alpha/beta fold hydrolase n=1 Tax=Paracoccus sp. MC1862 TaxID=2760307 RepID=UPI0016003384|nr:alpha/beta fold hydrolase [Paracoccus sp. MC1862]MBB1496748.1 alpha/beta fold hydrolase [Paracoccus sp. MC1862]